MITNLFIVCTILILLILGISKLNIHPFVGLILAALLLGITMGMGGEASVEILLEGFCNTLKWIAIVVILGAFIGEVLRETGGAVRISDNILKFTGLKKLPWAMGLTGYIVSIPVFVDVAYILFQPITEGLARKSKTPILVVGLSLVAGLTVSHTLMPPTPGPLAVASILGVDIGKLLWINAFVAIFAVGGGVTWAKIFCKRFRITFDYANIENIQGPESNLNLTFQKTTLLFDLMPILVPILLMAIGAFIPREGLIGSSLKFLSIPMVAVLIGAFLSVIQFFKLKEKRSRLNQLVENAITKTALVIMITGAGGALGYVISESGVQDTIAIFFSTQPALGLFLPFILAAVFTTATGSITVSLIATASILSPVSESLPYSKEIMAALIGCGSFCVLHANSSFFWLLNKLHNVPVDILYKSFTLQSFIMGLSGLVSILFLLLLGVY